MKLSVVIPVYNESRFIEQILERVLAAKVAGVEKEIIVVDDFSTDGTREKLSVIKRKNVRVVFHDVNLGKGSAIKTGLQHATGGIILFQDADLEYDPGDYEKLVRPIIDNHAVVVYGSRFLGKPFLTLGRDKIILPSHTLGNKILTFITNLLYGKKLTDMETGYKVFKQDIIKNLSLKSKRFDIEPEITSKLLKKRIRIFEVPISYFARDFSQGKKITWKDGIKAAWYLLKYRFSD